MGKEELIEAETAILARVKSKIASLRTANPNLAKFEAMQMALAALPKTYEKYLATRAELARLGVPPQPFR